MTPRQRALGKLSPRWQSAEQLQEPVEVLDDLVKCGRAELWIVEYTADPEQRAHWNHYRRPADHSSGEQP